MVARKLEATKPQRPRLARIVGVGPGIIRGGCTVIPAVQLQLELCDGVTETLRLALPAKGMLRMAIEIGNASAAARRIVRRMKRDN